MNFESWWLCRVFFGCVCVCCHRSQNCGTYAWNIAHSGIKLSLDNSKLCCWKMPALRRKYGMKYFIIWISVRIFVRYLALKSSLSLSLPFASYLVKIALIFFCFCSSRFPKSSPEHFWMEAFVFLSNLSSLLYFAFILGWSLRLIVD